MKDLWKWKRFVIRRDKCIASSLLSLFGKRISLSNMLNLILSKRDRSIERWHIIDSENPKEKYYERNEVY